MSAPEHERLKRLANLLRQVANELDGITARVSREAMTEARRALGGDEDA